MSLAQGKAPPTRLFDENAQAQRIARARKRQRGNLPFLADRAIEDLTDRLQDVNRTFTRACLVGPFDWRDAIFAALPPGKVETFDWSEEPIKMPSRAEYDLVISLLHLQSVNAVGGWMQAVRGMLVPDGLFLAALIGGDSLSGLRQALYAVDTERFGAPTPRIHPMIEVRAAAQLLAHVGLAIPVTDSDRFIVHYRKLETFAADLRDLGLTNALTDRHKVASPSLLRDLQSQLYTAPDQPAPIQWELVWMTGWAPHESQQKPLERGSAKVGLNEALKAIRDKS